MEEVPKPVRLAFIENNPIARAAAQVFQHTLVSQAGETVVHYIPTFVGYSEQVMIEFRVSMSMNIAAK